MLLIYAFILHFIADFLLQNRRVATKKSEDFGVLIEHLIIIYCTVHLGLLAFLPGAMASKFAALNALIHGVIDWNIWKLYKLSVYYRIKKESKVVWDSAANGGQGMERTVTKNATDWAYYEDRWFYNTIGLDQLLHGITLIVIWQWELFL